MTIDILQDSLFIPYRDGQLHLRHIRPPLPTALGIPILMLHGAMSNGRVFYSETGRGLGCFLAKAGFDVYVMDTAGRGLSEPRIDRDFTLGQGEVIREQLPLVQQFILQRHPLVNKVHWCAHSWGGVLMASSLARYPDLQSSVASLLTFGSKRTIKVRSLKKWLMVDFFWNRFAPLCIARQGYFDASRFRVGMDNESRASLLQTIDWVRGDWVDHDDNFHYAQAASTAVWPPAWFIAGKNDNVLGNPSDVRDMIDECGFSQVKYTLLAKEKGNLLDYDHAGMLTHRQAEQDHFVQIKQWYLTL
ncbi:alpha/beta fold hydrolase [Shewanella livingstonensis]|uniref:Alpha/beta fold hydrolase n=1 Tax=Shewanella livingstonensis TaxID=150120 RepID=A0A3G8LSR7_9GAMM|nr:alpha/beta hydrolase [Shewanella livingstonensis]AZG72497.1 alpha/beta fold hydrolase [Shewanella livingstonensis]